MDNNKLINNKSLQMLALAFYTGALAEALMLTLTSIFISMHWTYYIPGLGSMATPIIIAVALSFILSELIFKTWKTKFYIKIIVALAIYGLAYFSYKMVS